MYVLQTLLINLMCTELSQKLHHIIYQGLIDSKEKRACNLVPIKTQIEAKNSNKLCTSYSTKVHTYIAKVTRNSTVLLLV